MSTIRAAQAADRTPTRILGIDPGLSGGWALIDTSGSLLDAGGFPTHTVKKSGKPSTQLNGSALAQHVQSLNATHAFVEAVSSRPRQAGQFQFGINTGVIHGILHAHRIPFELVAPASWKGLFGIKRADDETKREKKDEARQLVVNLFPGRANLFARVKDDGPAEATLIALYGLYLITQR